MIHEFEKDDMLEKRQFPEGPAPQWCCVAPEGLVLDYVGCLYSIYGT